MNIAQNVCFFAKDILQDTLYQLMLIHLSHFAVEKNHEKAYLMTLRAR